MLLFAPFLALDLTFFAANLLKLFDGGWLPLGLAMLMVITMTSWIRGTGVVQGKEAQAEMRLEKLIRMLMAKPLQTVPGTAVSGWESRIYGLGSTQILRIPNPEPEAETRVRARATFTASLPQMPFAVPRVREISRVDGVLVTIEDRIAGRALVDMLPALQGDRRRLALAAYLETAEAMAMVRTEGDFGELLVPEPMRCPRWGEYLARRLDGFVDDAVLARDVPNLTAIAARARAQLLALPDPEKCVVHGDIWPPNVMMDEDLRVTGLIDFSFTTRVGDTLMDVAGAAHFNCIANPYAADDLAYLSAQIEARHGAGFRDLFRLYGVWFAFSFAYAHDDPDVYPWCLEQIRAF